MLNVNFSFVKQVHQYLKSCCGAQKEKKSTEVLVRLSEKLQKFSFKILLLGTSSFFEKVIPVSEQNQKRHILGKRLFYTSGIDQSNNYAG